MNSLLQFVLCFVASGFGIGAAIYLLTAVALLLRGDFADGLTSVAVGAVPAAIYGASWLWLPMENWIIVPAIIAIPACIPSAILAFKNGA